MSRGKWVGLLIVSLLPPARMHERVKQSVCQSVCLVKNFEISTFTRLKDCCTQQWHMYLIETKAVHSSAFPALFYLTLVLSTILLRLSTCSQYCKKLGGGLGTRQVKYGMLLSASTWAWWGWSVASWGRSVTLWSWFVESIRGCGRWAQVQLESLKALWSSIPTTSFNIIV